MPVLTPRVLHALLERAAGQYPGTIMTAIALAETGGELSAVVGDRRGPWLISDARGYDRNRMVTDGAYAAAAAWAVHQAEGYTPWPTYRDESYRVHLNAARQAAAQAAAVTGSILAEDGTYVPASYYAEPVAPRVEAVTAGVGTPLAASYQSDRPLTGLRIIGTEVQGDFASSVIGTPRYEAGWTTVPNLGFTIADPEGDLLWRQGNLWVRGARVEYLDLDMRIDEITFEPGSHTTGQLTITSIDAIIYALQLLRGARTARGVSVAEWLRQEMSLCGYDPSRYLLAEAGPSQTEIARDVPDQAGQTGSGEIPSAWTTAVRLGKETGKRIFVSGRKLIYGSAEFAMEWAAPGDLKLGYHNVEPGERWLSLPTAKQTSVGDRMGVTEVTGRVPFNRARFFRPGASVIVTRTPAVAASDRRLVCSDVSYDIGRDIDGADITLIEPVNLVAAPPTAAAAP